MGPSVWLNSQIITTDACTASYRKKVLSLHLQDNLDFPCSGVSKVPAASDWVTVSHLCSLYSKQTVRTEETSHGVQTALWATASDRWRIKWHPLCQAFRLPTMVMCQWPCGLRPSSPKTHPREAVDSRSPGGTGGWGGGPPGRTGTGSDV